jgi:hypothetical protein
MLEKVFGCNFLVPEGEDEISDEGTFANNTFDDEHTMQNSTFDSEYEDQKRRRGKTRRNGRH